MTTGSVRMAILGLALCAGIPLPASADLVLHYTFDKADDRLVYDSSPQGNDGIIHGATQISDGVFGDAMRFDGVDDYIRVPRSPSLEPDQLTVTAWLRVHQFPDSFALLVHKRNPSFNNNEDYDFQVWNGGGLRGVLANGLQSRLDSAIPLARDQWHHVAMVFSPPELRLYVDGRLAGASPHPYPLSHNSSCDLLICATDHAYYPMALFLNCDLDELQIFNTPLAPAQIEEMAAAGQAAKSTVAASPAAPAAAGASEMIGVARLLAQDGSTAVSWACIPGESYELLWSTNLIAGFTVIASDLVSPEDHMTFVHPQGDVPAGFYAIRRRRPPDGGGD